MTLHTNLLVINQNSKHFLIATADELILSDWKGDLYHRRLSHLGEFKYDGQGFEEGIVIESRLTRPEDASSRSVPLPRTLSSSLSTNSCGDTT